MDAGKEEGIHELQDDLIMQTRRRRRFIVIGYMPCFFFSLFYPEERDFIIIF